MSCHAMPCHVSIRSGKGTPQATSHYLNQCWSSALMHVCVIRPDSLKYAHISDKCSVQCLPRYIKVISNIHSSLLNEIIYETAFQLSDSTILLDWQYSYCCKYCLMLLHNMHTCIYGMTVSEKFPCDCHDIFILCTIGIYCAFPPDKKVYISLPIKLACTKRHCAFYLCLKYCGPAQNLLLCGCWTHFICLNFAVWWSYLNVCIVCNDCAAV